MNPNIDESRKNQGTEGSGRQPYNPPQLTELGPIEELVQGSSGFGADGGGTPDCSKSV